MIRVFVCCAAQPAEENAVSLVEKALKKMQAGRRDARGLPMHKAPEPVVPVARVRVSEPATQRIGRSHGMDMPVISGKIVVVDRQMLRATHLLPPESDERELADQYRRIKRPLIKNADSVLDDPTLPPRQLIMVTSALPGEGKTFTAVNLALSMSMDKDHSILLVDADIAKPHVSELFGVRDEPGVLDVLSNPEIPIESVILPTDVPRLSILPVGRRSETATELLTSARMRYATQRLAEIYAGGIVLFDSSPVLLTSEAPALATMVGQILVVVRAETTPQHAVLETISTLGAERPISLMLNQVETPGVLSRYGYGYGFGYGYGYGQPVSRPQSPGADKPMETSVAGVGL
jgi:protein-tyrosine kinase